MMTDSECLCESPSQAATLVYLLRWRAHHTPHQRAYIFLLDGETKEAQLTYDELDRQARAIAAWLRSLAAMGERVLLLYPPGLEYIAAFFGCLYAGVVAVPAYPPQRHRSLPRLSAILADTGAKIALTTAQVSALMERLGEPSLDGEHLHWLMTDTFQEREERWQMPAITSDTLAFLQYTSGSTGTPKGVMVNHGNLLHNQRLIQQAFGHTEQTIVVGWLPLYHDMGLIGNVLQPLYLGVPCILMSPYHFLQQPLRWLQAISRYQATTSGGPNFAYDLCARRITPEQRSALDLSSWTVAFNGAEPVRAATLERFTEAFEPRGFRRGAFYPCYGLAEATLIVSGGERTATPIIWAVSAAALEQHQVVTTTEEEKDARILVGCGHTLLEQQIRIVDPETLYPCSNGQVGEVWVKGPSVAQGYWNRPEETEHTFRARLSPTSEGPFLRTGDLGFIQDGELFITGRRKDLIIIRGRNLYPHDLELTAEQSYPGLRPGCGAAFSVEVDDEEQLVVVQEVDHRNPLDLDAAASAIRQAVAEDHEVQVYAVVLIKPGSLPKTSSGKIQRHATRAVFLAGSLEVVGVSLRGAVREKETFVAARTPLEKVIAGIWEAVLGLNQVGINDSFFALGGDSLRGTQVISRLHEALQIQLTLESLFERPTIAELAEHIEQCRTVDRTPPVMPLHPIARTSEIPLSFAQQRLWFLDQLIAGNPFNNIPVALKLRGSLDVAVFEKALAEIVRRHETLRTTFLSIDGQPKQVIAPAATVRLPINDLRGLAETEQEAEVRRLTREEARRPFDLSKGPLLRLSLLRLGEIEHVLLLTIHHIVSDHWSMGILSQELGLLYDAFFHGLPSPLNELPIQYADFALCQRQWLQGKVLEAQLSYWKAQLDAAPMLNLPTDRPRPAANTFGGECYSFTLSKPLTEALKALSEREGVTLFVTLLAAFQTLLYRYTSQDDICIGTSIANRTRVEMEQLIGLFVNMLVLRTKRTGNLTFQALLRRVLKVALGAFAHQDLPFEMLVEALQPERDMSRTPLFQVAFSLQNAPSPSLKLTGLTVAPLETHSGTTKFDLALSMTEEANGLTGSLEYSTELFDAATITRMVGHFKTLLEGVATRPEVRLSELPLLSEEERHQLLVKWNATEAAYPQALCLHQAFERQAQKTPEAVAVVCEGELLTYAELNARANQLAHSLHAVGVGPEILVGLCLERSLELVVGVLGILKAGGAYIPLDPSYPKERLAFLLADARVPLLLTQKQLLEALPEGDAEVVCLDQDWEAIARESAQNLPLVSTPDHAAYVIYTSGSTGRPKGVLVTHGNVLRLFEVTRQHFDFTERDVWTLFHSYAFDFSVWELWGALLHGGRLVVVPYWVSRSPEAFYELLCRQEVTVLNQTPSAFSSLSQVEVAREAAKELSLRVIIFGGEALEPHHLKAWLERHGDAYPQLVNMYGITETTVHVTYHRVFKTQGLEAEAHLIGRPLSDLQAYVLDPDLNLAPIGIPGELYIGGVGLARGYLNRPELTAAQFIPHPFSREPGARLYKTGDRARYRPDGVIEFLGRLDQQVKIRGFRIELGEIEAVLHQHPAVREAVVIIHENGPSDRRLLAYMIAQQRQVLKSSELRHFVKERLPDYMIPAAFVMLDAIPLTRNGKVDRCALPAPVGLFAESGAAYVAPQTEIECSIAAVWQEVLHVETVGIHDNFFDLGGHSLLMAKVWSKLRDVFQRELSMMDLFRHPTVEALAKYLAQTESEPSASYYSDALSKKLRAGKDRLNQQLQRRQRAAERR